MDHKPVTRKKNVTKRNLEIRFSREQRINDHDIPKVSLYCNGKEIYSARYESCVIDTINERFAKKTRDKLKKKLSELGDKKRAIDEKIYAVQKTLNKPLVKVEGWRND